MALTPGSIALIVAIAACTALAVAGAGLLVLRLGRRWRLASQLRVVVLAPLAATVAGSLAVALAMFLSVHDLAVTLWVTGVSALVSLGIASLLARSFLRTTRDLTASTRALVEGEAVPSSAHRATEAHRTTELAQLAGELATTGRRLAEARADVERLETSRRDLVAWVSHDLRTPLASVRAMAEALEDGLVDDAARYHRGIRTQIDRVSALVDDLFELSKLHAGSLRLQRSPVSVYDLVSDQIADLAPLADEHGIRITATGDLDAVIDVDARQLARALSNLLTNSLQHSPHGGRVEVHAAASPDAVEVSVTDAGGGIALADLPRIFEAGWRADPARIGLPQIGAGAGLGLAIVRGIVMAHGGTVEAVNVPGGSRFTIRVPGAAVTVPVS